MEWPVEEVRLYAKYRKSLRYKTSTKSKSSTPPPPPADSMPSPRGDIEHRIDSFSVTVTNLAELVHSKLEALTASLCAPPLTQLSSQPRLGPDVCEPQPSVTAGSRCKFQALGVPDGTPVVPLTESPPVGQGVSAPSMEQSGSASAPPPQLAPIAAPPPSEASAPRQLLHSLRFLCPSRPRPVGFRMALLLLAPLMTPVRPRSRRLVTLRCVTLRPLVWLTSFTRSAQNLVRLWTRCVRRAVGLRPGSASLSHLLLSSAFGSTPGLLR